MIKTPSEKTVEYNIAQENRKKIDRSTNRIVPPQVN